MPIAPAYSIFDEITDFLPGSPTPEEIIAYQSSDVLNNRLHDLLEKNAADQLITAERSELDTFLHMGHLLTLLKAKARLKIAGEQ